MWNIFGVKDRFVLISINYSYVYWDIDIDSLW